MKMTDVLIIGGGMAGLTAGMYVRRAGFSAVVFEKMFAGGQAATTYEVENYPGFPDPIAGPDLMGRVLEQTQRFGLEISYDEVTGMDLNGPIKKVETTKGVWEGRTVILATGARPKKLEIEGEIRLTGQGVSYCATCDGAFFKGKRVAVVGGGNTAIEDALYLANLGCDVHLIHRRDQLRAIQVLGDRAKDDDRITFHWNTIVTAIEGEQKVERLQLEDTETGEKSTLDAEGVFIGIGIEPANELLHEKITLTEYGQVLTDFDLATDVVGVYAAGDVRYKSIRQIVASAADGAVAATSAIRYLMEGPCQIPQDN